MLLVDTSVWVPYFNGQISEKVNALDYLLGRELIVMGDLVLAEVLQGFVQNDHYKAAIQILSTLETRSLVGRDISIKAAENARLLRQEGINNINIVDLFIATYCSKHNLTLLHDDKSFYQMEELLNVPCY